MPRENGKQMETDSACVWLRCVALSALGTRIVVF